MGERPSKPLNSLGHVQRLSGRAFAKGGEDLPESGGWDGRGDHRAMALSLWSPDQHCHHLGNALEMCDISPSQTYWIRNLGVGPSELWFKGPST